MTESIAAQQITLRRVLDAPRELVWKAWTEPDRLAQWFGARGWSNPLDQITMEVRPGGTFRVTHVEDASGAEMTTIGVYREIEPPGRLVLEESSGDSWHEGAVSELTLSDLGDGRTELVLRATIHTTDEMRAQAERGMGESLDRLAGYVV
jgi:uncharacterized protein YndB with AHSA1/START domain